MGESGLANEVVKDRRLRYGSAADIGALVAVCRQSFPASLRWQGLPRIAERWWRVVLATSAAETYVLESHGVVTAFCLLVTNLECWTQERACRKAPLLPGFLSALVCPILATRRVWKACGAASPWGGNAVDIVRRDLPRPRTWIELIAVEPAMRGCGAARVLLHACEVRTLELGGGAIGLSVEIGNEPATRLYESAGYVAESSAGPRRVYVKTLASTSLSSPASLKNAKNGRSDGESGA